MKRVYALTICLFLSVLVFSGCTDKIEKSKKLYEEGIKLVKEGKSAEAEKNFKKCIELDPKNATPMFQIGFMHSKVEDERGIAINYFKKGLEIEPNNEIAHYVLANLYAKEGQTENEISELHQVLNINNDNEDAHYTLGLIYAQKRLYEDSELSFNEVLRINPKAYDAIFNIGVIYVRRGDNNKALEIVEKLKVDAKEKADELEKLIHNEGKE